MTIRCAAAALYAGLAFLYATPATACVSPAPSCPACQAAFCDRELNRWTCDGFSPSGISCTDSSGACTYSGFCDGAGTCVQTSVTKQVATSALPTTTTAGASTNVTVAAQQCSSGTWVADTAYTGNMSVTSSDPTFTPQSYQCTSADSGSHTFTVTLKTAGSQTVTTNDNLSSPGVPRSQSTSVGPGQLDHIVIDEPMVPPVTTGSTLSVCFHPNGAAIETTGYWIGATLYDTFGNTTTSPHTFRVVSGDPLQTGPDLTTTTSTLRWGQCANAPINNGITFYTPGTWTQRVVDLSNSAIPTVNPPTIQVDPGKAHVVVHMVTDGVVDAVPGGVTVTVSAAGQPGGTVTSSPTQLDVTSNTTYVIHSTAPLGYAVSYSTSASSAGGQGKEVQLTTPNADSTVDVTFTYSHTNMFASWLGDFDPPTASPSGAGLGQWGQAHCGEAAREGSMCPVGSQTVFIRAGASCTADLDCTDPANPVCSNGQCSHTSGATEQLSLNNNVQPASGRFQISGTFARFQGGHSLRVEVDHGDTWSDANDRNELTRASTPTDYSDGMEGWFAWSTYFDQFNFENVDLASVNPFNTITQWHHQGLCSSEPLGFGMNNLSKMIGGGSNSVFGLGLSSTELYMDPGCDAPSANPPCNTAPAGTTFQSTSHYVWVAKDTQPALTGGAPLSGKWLDFLFHVKFSKSNGFVELWYRTDPNAPYQQQGLSCSRGAPFTSARCNIKTMYAWPSQTERTSTWYLNNAPDFCFQNDTGAFVYGQDQHNDIQQGWYRSSQLQTTSVLFHDGMTQGAHLSDVLPSGSGCQCLRSWGDGTTTCQNDDQPCPL